MSKIAQQNLTAVDWLVQELKSKGHALITTEGVFINVPNELLEQAKAMEKEQIKDAYWNGTMHITKEEALSDAEKFYNEYYNKPQ